MRLSPSALIVVATVSASFSRLDAFPSADGRRSMQPLDAVPAKPIQGLSILVVDGSGEGGDIQLKFADGSTYVLSTGGRAQAT